MSVFFVLRDDMVVEIRLKDLVKKGRFKMFEKWGLVKVNYWWSLSFLLENCVKMFFKGMMMFCGIFWNYFFGYCIVEKRLIRVYFRKGIKVFILFLIFGKLYG